VPNTLVLFHWVIMGSGHSVLAMINEVTEDFGTNGKKEFLHQEKMFLLFGFIVGNDFWTTSSFIKRYKFPTF